MIPPQQTGSDSESEDDSSDSDEEETSDAGRANDHSNRTARKPNGVIVKISTIILLN